MEKLRKILALLPACVLLFFASCKMPEVQIDPYANSMRSSVVGQWFLAKMHDADGIYDVSADITLVFPDAPKNGIHGCAGVNYYNGTAFIGERSFSLGTLAVTEMAGGEDAMEAEENFLRLLNLCTSIRTESVKSENGDYRKLILYNATDGIELEFVGG